mgnify:CR=1 FL=1
MKNLIISDNPTISIQIHEINEGLGISDQFDWYYSQGNNITFPSLFQGCLNLKNQSDRDFIINNHEKIFSIHSKQLFPLRLTSILKCYNLHPGYNPLNRGWYPQVFAIINKLEIGATLHRIDEQLDHGEIIARKKLYIPELSTSKEVYEMVLDLEKEIWKSNIKSLLEDNYSTIQPEELGVVRFKSDFKKLLELDLDSEGSLREHLDLLRALTHPPYNNAFVKNKAGKKFYVSINFKPESISESLK